MIDAQSEDFGCVTSLDAVALTLTSVTGDDSEVCTSDSEDSAAVVRVGVEGALLGVGERAVGHCGKSRGV